MNAKKWSLVLFGFVALAAVAAAALSASGLLDMFTHEPAPVHARVRMDASGFNLSQDFRIRKYCSYDFELRLIHTQRRMGELDRLITNRSLPITVTVDVYRLNGSGTERVAQLSGMPKLYAHAPDHTAVLLGFVTLDKGHYRAEISSAGDAPQLAGIEADVVVQRRPKATCAPKAQ